MELIINNKPITLEVSTIDLETLITDFCQEYTKGIAVAVNQRVIPKAEWKNCILKEKDQVLLITATQGG